LGSQLGKWAIRVLVSPADAHLGSAEVCSLVDAALLLDDSFSYICHGARGLATFCPRGVFRRVYTARPTSFVCCIGAVVDHFLSPALPLFRVKGEELAQGLEVHLAVGTFWDRCEFDGVSSISSIYQSPVGGSVTVSADQPNLADAGEAGPQVSVAHPLVAGPWGLLGNFSSRGCDSNEAAVDDICSIAGCLFGYQFYSISTMGTR
jgi:hypothetical protein